MAFLFVMLVLGVVSIQVETQQDSKATLDNHPQYTEACLKKTHLDPNLLAEAVAEANMDDPTVQQYVYCMSQEFGFQDKEGNYAIPVIKELTISYFKNETLTDELVDKCVDKSHSPAVESAVKTFTCYVKETGLILL